jgi:hypothetical protein
MPRQAHAKEKQTLPTTHVIDQGGYAIGGGRQSARHLQRKGKPRQPVAVTAEVYRGADRV